MAYELGSTRSRPTMTACVHAQIDTEFPSVAARSCPLACTEHAGRLARGSRALHGSLAPAPVGRRAGHRHVEGEIYKQHPVATPAFHRLEQMDAIVAASEGCRPVSLMSASVGAVRRARDRSAAHRIHARFSVARRRRSPVGWYETPVRGAPRATA